MVTRADEVELLALGFSQAAIDKMAPAAAHEILRMGVASSSLNAEDLAAKSNGSAAKHPAEAPWTTPSLLDRLEQEAGEKAQSAEDVAAKAKADLLASLEEKAFFWIARGLEANIDLGRVFNQIKPLVEHGSWEDRYKAKFAPRGIPLRTGQEYMRMAREADAVTENANSALFSPATDPQATEVNLAVEQAKQDVANAGAAPPPNPQPGSQTKKARKPRLRLDGIYNLKLRMTGDEKDSTDQLVRSQNWHCAHMEIMAFLRRLHVKYGVVADPATLPAQSRNHPELPPEDPYQATDGDLPSALFGADLPFDEVPDNANDAA